jgi:hypothetical protein
LQIPPSHREITGIFEVGQLLIEAKAALPHGEFTAMVEGELPFGRRIRAPRRHRSRCNSVGT